jgi:hypothetical protein
MSNHELTGEPYLGITMYSPVPHVPHRGRWAAVWSIHHVDERGREYWSARRWTTAPFRLLYRIEKALAPTLCKLGMHIVKSDIHEIDGSVWRAGCSTCRTLVRARRPQPADPAEVARWTGYDEEGDKLEEALEAYQDGTGPCPWCEYPNGEHEYTCWEAE